MARCRCRCCGPRSSGGLPTEAVVRDAAPLPRFRRAGLFLLAVLVGSVVGALAEWTVRWVLPAVLAQFVGRSAGWFPVFYWMPVILAEVPPWSLRRRRRFAVVAGMACAALAWVTSVL